MANNSVILLRVEPRLKREIERCAEANERSVSQEVRLEEKWRDRARLRRVSL